MRKPLVYLPAAWLYDLAFSPQRCLDPQIEESLQNEGWLEKWPAVLTLRRGCAPKIDGQHRLSYLARSGNLDLLVPCIVKHLQSG